MTTVTILGGVDTDTLLHKFDRFRTACRQSLASPLVIWTTTPLEVPLTIWSWFL